MGRASLVSSCILWLAACSRPDPWKVVAGRDLPPAKGPPKITALEDHGTARVPRRGRWHDPGRGDGRLVPGEVLVVRGRNLGRLPTVQVGGRPVRVLARLADGALVVRIPAAARDGAVTVAGPHGLARARLPLQRYLLAWLPTMKEIALFDVSGPRPKRAGSLPVDHVQDILVGPAPSVAHVLTGRRLLTVDLAAAGGPRLVHQRKLPASATLLRGAAESHLLAVLEARSISLWDVSLPTVPSPWSRLPLPKDLETVSDLALSPDGKILVVAGRRQLLFADVADHAAPRWAGRHPLPLEGITLRLVGILRQDTDEGPVQRLVVLASDDAETLSLGPHEPLFLQARIFPAPDRDSPVRLGSLERKAISFTGIVRSWAVTFNPAEVISGTALRQDPARMLLYLAMDSPAFARLPRPLDSPAGRQALAALRKQAGSLGYLVALDGRGQIRRERPGPAAGAVAVAVHGSPVWALGCRMADQAARCGLLQTAASGRQVFVPLVQGSPALLDPVVRRARLAVQP